MGGWTGGVGARKQAQTQKPEPVTPRGWPHPAQAYVYGSSSYWTFSEQQAQLFFFFLTNYILATLLKTTLKRQKNQSDTVIT